jgi:hypothetical protein
MKKFIMMRRQIIRAGLIEKPVDITVASMDAQTPFGIGLLSVITNKVPGRK